MTMSVASRLPRPELPAWNRTIRAYASRLVVRLLMLILFRMRLEGRANLPKGPALYCFNHLNWIDPFALYASLPLRPRLYMYGPKEDDLRAGPRNRMMYFTAAAIPYKPSKSDLRESARQVAAVFESGSVLAIAGEGRIHVGERELLEIQPGAAYFAIRAGVPIVPVAINGTSWLDFRRTIRVRIGRPITTEGKATSERLQALSHETWLALRALVANAPEPKVPGRFGRWLTELFNDWPEGSREASAEVRGPSGILAPDPGSD